MIATMRRIFAFVVFLTMAGSAAAQQAPSATEQAVGWLRTQWARVEKAGAPMAQQILQQYPARFADMQAQVARVRKLADRFSHDHKLPEKQALLQELWRVRGSLNLMALCSPDMVEQLTGLDTNQVKRMQSELATIRTKLITGKLSSP